jgi:hypothetical protein
VVPGVALPRRRRRGAVRLPHTGLLTRTRQNGLMPVPAPFMSRVAVTCARGAVRAAAADGCARVTFPSITNRGEFFSNHYLDAVIGGDLGDLRKAWDEAEGEGEPSARSTLKGAASRFLQDPSDGQRGDRRPGTAAIEHLNDVVLHALGFDPNRNDIELTRNTTDKLTIPTAATAETGTGLWLVALGRRSGRLGRRLVR